MQWLFETGKQDTKLPKIIRAAVALFVRQGIDATTTKQIAEAADVAEGTLYRHFKSKEELADTVFVTHLEAFTQEMDRAAAPVPHTKEKLRALIRCYFSFFEAERVLFEYVLSSETRDLRRYPHSKRHPFHVVVDVLTNGISHDHLPQQNVTLAAAYVIGIVSRVSVFRIYERIDENLIHFIDEVTDACWRAVGGK